MQPSKNPVDLSRYKQIWETFTESGIISDEMKMDPLITSSWLRCGKRLNPNSPIHWVYESETALKSTLKKMIPLRDIALPIMEDIYQFIEGSSAVLLLTDSTGCLLEMIGDPQTMHALQQEGLKVGAYLDEGRLGTNAIAVTLFNAMPSQVIGAEHFFSKLHVLSSVAASFNELGGHPIGVLGLIEPLEKRSEQSFGIVVAGARAIENQLRADLIVRDANTQTAELIATMDSITEGVLAWTHRGIIIHMNEQAGKTLHLSPNTVVGRSINEFISLPENLARSVSMQQELSDVETSLLVDGTQRECLVSLRIVAPHENDNRVYIMTIRRIQQVHQLVNRLVGAQARLTLDDIVGHGSAAKAIRKQALTAANAKACVLLMGESGTGKNILARAIHNSGKRAAGPFLAMNCRAIPRDLAQGEFLGYEAGAFNSGPSTGQPSKIELAHGGTLFLEEIESLPLETQAALQRVIEMGDVIRLGGTRVIPADARIIASTTRTVEELLEQDSFRHDLLLRLSSFLITLEPLRKRPEDIPVLVERLLDKLVIQLNRPLKISAQALDALCAYPWPGNVRELETIMERAAIQCESGQLELEHFSTSIKQNRVLMKGKSTTKPVQSMVEAEQAAIIAACSAAHGNVTQTAQLLGIGRTTLWRRMKELNISAEDFE
jgi:transcriptional regulator of acetoin/glycerol metabolism